MQLINELLYRDLGKLIIESYKAVDIDYNNIVQTKALSALEEIKETIHNNELDDFMKVDRIVNILTENNINTGGCHDF